MRLALAVGCLVSLWSVGTVRGAETSSVTRPDLPSHEAPMRPRVPAPPVPRVFEVNRGQAPATVDFVFRAHGYTAFLTHQGATLAFDKAALRLSFDGAEGRRVTAAGHELPGRTNFLLGPDPSRWITEVPQFDGVDYAGGAGDMSVRWLAPSGVLRFDLALPPGCDPSRARFEVEGADRLDVGPSGALDIEIAGGRASLSRPVAWQELGSERRDVAARFVIDGTRVAVSLGDHDPSLAVFVDPSLTYGTLLGSSYDDEVAGVAVDSSGNAYLAGDSTSAGFPTTSGAYDTSKGQDASSTARSDLFVAKLSSDGSSLTYSTFIGGNADELARGIAVDSSGNAFICGYSYGSDYPTTSGVMQPTKTVTGSPAGVLTKLNSSGSGLSFSTYVNEGYCTCVAIDSSGNCYLGLGNIVRVMKVDSTGSNQSYYLIFPTNPGGGGVDDGETQGIAVDSSGNAYFTGYTKSSRYPTTTGAPKTSITGQNDAVVTKLDSSGAISYSTYLGGSSFDYGQSIGVDKDGQAYVTGYTQSSNFPTTSGAYQTSLAGQTDAFFVKLNSDGTSLSYATYFGGSGGDIGSSIAVHPCGAVCIAGVTDSTTSFPLLNAVQTTGSVNGVGFAARFDRVQNLAWSTYLGYGYLDNACVAMNGAGTTQLAGRSPSGFPTAGSPYQSSASGNYDAWAAQIPNVPETTNPLAVSTSSLPATTAGVSYSTQLTTSGGVPSSTWTVASGALPIGLTLSTSGLLSGTATQPGTYPFKVQAQDGCEVTATANLSLAVNRAPTVDTIAFPAWTVGVAYSKSAAASGGTGVLALSVTGGALPPGLGMSSTGVVSGTPTQAGDYSATVRVTDQVGGWSERVVPMRINFQPAIDAKVLPDTTETRPYAATFTVAGGTGPYSWVVASGKLPTTKPADLTPATGVLSGAADAAGDYSFTLRVTDAAGAHADRAFSAKVNPFPAITTTDLPLAATGRPYATALTGTGGTPLLAWSVATGPLPPGMQISSTTGALTGTPTVAGRYPVEISYDDARGASGRRTFVIECAGAPDMSKRKASESLNFSAGTSRQVVRYVELLEGTVMRMDLLLVGKGQLGATLELLDADEQPVDLAMWTKTTRTAVHVKGFVVPHTGRYFVVTTASQDFKQGVRLSLAIAPLVTWAGETSVGAAAVSEIRFSVPPGSVPTISAKSSKTSLALPHIAALIAPDGNDVLAPEAVRENGKSASLKGVTPLVGGDYVMRLSSRDGAAGSLKWKIQIRPAKTYGFALPDLPTRE